MSITDRIRSWLAKRRYAARERRIAESCGCICYCPHCRDPLNDQASMLKAGVWDNLVVYRCSKCLAESRWDFDSAPVPLLVGYGWDRDARVKEPIEQTRIMAAKQPKETTDGK